MEVASIKRELAEIKIQRTNQIIFRSKARWAMVGEKPTAYFLGLEKRQQKTKVISAIKDDQGRIHNNPKEILLAEKSYFEKIYTEDTASLDPIDTFPLTEDDIPRLSEDNRYMLELPFSPREFHAASKSWAKINHQALMA